MRGKGTEGEDKEVLESLPGKSKFVKNCGKVCRVRRENSNKKVKSCLQMDFQFLCQFFKRLLPLFKNIKYGKAGFFTRHNFFHYVTFLKRQKYSYTGSRVGEGFLKGFFLANKGDALDIFE